ncbi:YbaY family lipoprotein [Litorimonas haliclonae]|uniref:YbaY family lipoprotein n=1 Tax=Litorimonas haliclonae TaxID=2081977 RepID=UPI0039EF220C
MHLLKSALPVLILFGGLAGCTEATNTPSEASDSVEAQAEMKEVTGQISYRERIALRPRAVAEIELQDISVADRAAPVLEKQIIELDGQQVPVNFKLSVDPRELEPRGRYSIRAAINDGNDRLLFTTDTVHLVEPGPEDVDLGLLILRQNATAPEGEESEGMRVYSCGDTNAAIMPGEDMIQLKVDGVSYDLPRIPSASGEKYQADIDSQTIMFWSKGETALMKIGETSYPECRS